MNQNVLPMTNPPKQLHNWSAIMQHHRGWLGSVVYARLRDSDAVEEVLQETALAASRHSQVASDQLGICKWLYRVAVRQALLYRRQQSRINKKLNGAFDACRSNQVARTLQHNPYQILIASEKQELVQAALSQLLPKDYEVLMLKYRDGWSCREMAARLEVSESAMKSRLLRARNNLRCELLRIDESWESA